MDNKILYVILWIIAAGYIETCEVTYNESLCAYTETCYGYLNLYEDLSTFRVGVRRDYDPSWCLKEFMAENNERYYYVYLILQRQNDDNTLLVPHAKYEEDEYALYAIYGLSLSSNGYSQTPLIRRMANLVVLDISNNFLTTAVLSNANELPRLAKINLSHNLIINIEVDYNGHLYKTLTDINLSHNNLIRLPDGIFGEFDQLLELDLSYNNIEMLSVTTFENVRTLRSLNLSNNKLTDLNSSLFRFSNLKILNLSNNLLKVIKLADFEQLRNLEVLDLNSNLIKHINVDVFSTMVSLVSLYLNNNQLEILDRDAFASLESLDKIDLSKNMLKKLPIGLFKNTMILTFSIEDNKLEGALEMGMFNGVNITNLDLSNQYLTNIYDFAFCNLSSLNTLLLNSNYIKNISQLSFKTLVNLQQLDLSNNQISNIDFSKEDFINLRSLLLRNNRLTKINHGQLSYLSSLEYLDLSNNQIFQFESQSFKSLSQLINLEIKNNSLCGSLETGTFEGLVLLPSLDVSGNKITIIQNASFDKMSELKELNISHCNVSELQYNAFVNTEYIETLDLSYNRLKLFAINTTDLWRVNTLILNNNLIKIIYSDSLYGLTLLDKITLSHNAIESIHDEAFYELSNLRYLDLSNNERLNFHVPNLRNNNHLNTLILSGVKIQSNFSYITADNELFDLRLSNISVRNLSDLSLSKINRLVFLNLNCNGVSKLQIGDFARLNELRTLDLSFNQITSIQPGVFKDNIKLEILNVSHNLLSNIGYGVFRGLIHLSILDMSFNNIKDLQAEIFYETESLSILIVDYNKIAEIGTEKLQYFTSLTKISIGHNLLPCQTLAKILKHSRGPLEITAMRTDEHHAENINGVTCNQAKILPPMNGPEKEGDNNYNILNGLQSILYELTNRNSERENVGNTYLEKISNSLEKSNDAVNIRLSNLTSEVIGANYNTNTLLNKIINILNQTVVGISNISQFESIPNTHISSVAKQLETNESISLLLYIDKIKKELTQNMNRIENKIAMNSYHTEKPPTSVNPQLLVSNNANPKSYFTETCVALILLILVGVILYKLIKSRTFQRNRFSSATCELPAAMEHSAL